MKKLVFILSALFLLPALTLKAQIVDSTETQVVDTTRVKFGSKIITVIERENEDLDIKVTTATKEDKVNFDLNDGDSDCGDDKKKKKHAKFEGHWAGFEFGFNGLVDADNKFPAADHPLDINMVRSWTFGLNLFQKEIPLIANNFGLVTGLGMQWKNYHFDNEIRVFADNDGLTAVPFEDVKIKKNRLQATYLTIPVMFDLQFPIGPKKNEFFLMAGGYGSFKIGSNYKAEWSEGGQKFEDKIKDDYNLNKFDYGLTARIGIDDINLFANYSLAPLFEEGKGFGPENYMPVTVGIMIVGF